MKNNATQSDTTQFPQLLTIAFICLKLTNQIDWNWIWILSPIVISAVISALIDTLKK